MRSKPGRGSQRLEKALADLASALNATGVPWMVIGGIAVIARGVRRTTTDIDATVKGDQADVASLVRALAKKRIVPRIDNAERFASESLVLLLRHVPMGVEFDVSMAWTGPQRLRKVTRVCSPEVTRTWILNLDLEDR